MRPFRDPAASGLGRHDGRHPDIIKQIRYSSSKLADLVIQVDAVFEHTVELAKSGETYILMLYCQGGRHRSVAGATVIEYIGLQCGFQCSVRHIDFHPCNCAVCSGGESNRVEELRIMLHSFEDEDMYDMQESEPN